MRTLLITEIEKNKILLMHSKLKYKKSNLNEGSLMKCPCKDGTISSTCCDQTNEYKNISNEITTTEINLKNLESRKEQLDLEKEKKEKEINIEKLKDRQKDLLLQIQELEKLPGSKKAYKEAMKDYTNIGKQINSLYLPEQERGKNDGLDRNNFGNDNRGKIWELMLGILTIIATAISSVVIAKAQLGNQEGSY